MSYKEDYPSIYYFNEISFTELRFEKFSCSSKVLFPYFPSYLSV